MHLNVYDSPRDEKTSRRAIRYKRSEVVRKLYEELLRCGVTTAIPSVSSTRIKAYLSRPARMLHDGWRLVSFDQLGVVSYSVEGIRGARQILRYDKKAKEVELRTFCPQLGQSQHLIYSLERAQVLKNVLETRERRRKRELDLCRVNL